nr:hypothetical protein [Nostoc sp. PA-18-2419]
MKKIVILSTAALLFTGLSFANEGKDKEKGKDKPKKEKSAPKPCPGKECSKKKG